MKKGFPPSPAPPSSFLKLLFGGAEEGGAGVAKRAGRVGGQWGNVCCERRGETLGAFWKEWAGRPEWSSVCVAVEQHVANCAGCLPGRAGRVRWYGAGTVLRGVARRGAGMPASKTFPSSQTMSVASRAQECRTERSCGGTAASGCCGAGERRPADAAGAGIGVRTASRFRPAGGRST